MVALIGFIGALFEAEKLDERLSGLYRSKQLGTRYS
jgi:hypothetical protein